MANYTPDMIRSELGAQLMSLAARFNSLAAEIDAQHKAGKIQHSYLPLQTKVILRDFAKIGTFLDAAELKLRRAALGQYRYREDCNQQAREAYEPTGKPRGRPKKKSN